VICVNVPEIVVANLVGKIQKGRPPVRLDGNLVSEEERLFHFKFQTDGESSSMAKDDKCL